MRSTGQTEEFVYEAVTSGLLEIREDGTIWRVNGMTRRQIAATLPPSTKYLSIKVMRNGKQVTTPVQRLVYRHFNGKIPPGLTVNHRNGITTDNRPENLELATCAEQTRHAIETLRRHKTLRQNGEHNSAAKLTSTATREIRRRRAAGERLKSIATDFGVSDRTISKIARGDRWAHLIS